MPLKFDPIYKITPVIMKKLMRIEELKGRVTHLPLNPHVLRFLRETARLYTTHYSTMIEGNHLTSNEVDAVLKHEGHFPGRERDENEVKGYYAALLQVEKWAASGMKVTEKHVQLIHAMVMGDGKIKNSPSQYRDGQNVIRDSRTKAIIYLPPEAKDVPSLMSAFVAWINKSKGLPCPLVAAITHYQFATIHPYYDGNGRTARLLTTLVLYLGGYDLKGIYSLEEYYARNLGAYYDAISVGESHNYYMGRADADITQWVEYFISGMVASFENVLKHMEAAAGLGEADRSELMRLLDPRQRKVLSLFHESELITSGQVGELFGFKPRTIRAICAKWVEDGFLEIADSSKKARKYKLSSKYDSLL